VTSEGLFYSARIALARRLKGLLMAASRHSRRRKSAGVAPRQSTRRLQISTGMSASGAGSTEIPAGPAPARSDHSPRCGNAACSPGTAPSPAPRHAPEEIESAPVPKQQYAGFRFAHELRGRILRERVLPLRIAMRWQPARRPSRRACKRVSSKTIGWKDQFLLPNLNPVPQRMATRIIRLDCKWRDSARRRTRRIPRR